MFNTFFSQIEQRWKVLVGSNLGLHFKQVTTSLEEEVFLPIFSKASTMQSFKDFAKGELLDTY